MIRNYFRVIHIIVEKIIVENTQPVQGVPGTFPEGFLKVLTSGTYKGPDGDAGDQYKNWWFYEKSVFQK